MKKVSFYLLSLPVAGDTDEKVNININIFPPGEETVPARGRSDEDCEQGLPVRGGLHLPGSDSAH